MVGDPQLFWYTIFSSNFRQNEQKINVRNLKKNWFFFSPHGNESYHLTAVRQFQMLSLHNSNQFSKEICISEIILQFFWTNRHCNHTRYLKPISLNLNLSFGHFYPLHDSSLTVHVKNFAFRTPYVKTFSRFGEWVQKFGIHKIFSVHLQPSI